MPTIFTHAFVGLIGGKIFTTVEKPKFWILSALAPVVPDADVIGFSFGILYGSMLGHRGFSHSIIFALALAWVIMLAAFREIAFGSKKWFQYWIYFFLITLLHPILDAFTSGGLGVGLFIPLNEQRYFAPVRPIQVSPISVKKFLDGSGLSVLLSEFVWVWIPFLTAYLIKFLLLKFRKPRQSGNSKNVQ